MGYCEEVGCDVIELPTATYLVFRSEPFADEGFCEAIEAVQAYMNTTIRLSWFISGTTRIPASSWSHGEDEDTSSCGRSNALKSDITKHRMSGFYRRNLR